MWQATLSRHSMDCRMVGGGEWPSLSRHLVCSPSLSRHLVCQFTFSLTPNNPSPPPSPRQSILAGLTVDLASPPPPAVGRFWSQVRRGALARTEVKALARTEVKAQPCARLVQATQVCFEARDSGDSLDSTRSLEPCARLRRPRDSDGSCGHSTLDTGSPARLLTRSLDS